MATDAPFQSMPQGRPRDLWRIGDAAVLLAYSCVVLWTLQYHEKWADEAQAWLIARDLDLRTIWFHELRYEGSPGLWHTILWVAQHVFHAGYGALGYIGAAFAIAGAAVLLFLAPFPRYIRWPLAFTYVMVYQYAVIARPYTLFPLLAFLAAYFFKDTDRPERITFVLAVLALLTVHGTILAACLGLAYLWEAVPRWLALKPGTRKKYFLCLGTLAVVFAFVVAVVNPSPDVEQIAIKHQFDRAPAAVKATLPTIGPKLAAVISGAFIDYFVASVVLVLLLAVWCIWRRKWLAFVLSVGMLITFYISIYGYAHHHGTVFVAAISGLWIAWPTPDEKLQSARLDKRALSGVCALLFLLCALNIRDAAVVIQREYLYPYCGAQDAVNYLKSVGADRGPMFGLLYGVVAIQAYFDHNVFANNPTAYFHHGLPLDTTQLHLDDLYRIRPEYIVASSTDPDQMMGVGAPQLVSRGYQLVHFSDGYYLYKRSVYERATYFIFRKSWPETGEQGTPSQNLVPSPSVDSNRSK